nr:hypothetical protein [uncultured Sulfurimonas sp.]
MEGGVEIADPALKVVDVVISYDFANADLSDPDEVKKYYMYKSLTDNKKHPVWSPDGKWIAFSDDKYGVWMVPSEGGEPKLVYDNYYKVQL